MPRMDARSAHAAVGVPPAAVHAPVRAMRPHQGHSGYPAEAYRDENHSGLFQHLPHHAEQRQWAVSTRAVNLGIRRLRASTGPDPRRCQEKLLLPGREQIADVPACQVAASAGEHIRQFLSICEARAELDSPVVDSVGVSRQRISASSPTSPTRAIVRFLGRAISCPRGAAEHGPRWLQMLPCNRVGKSA
jgi:hypothetical protein